LGFSNWPVIYYTFPHLLGSRSFLLPLPCIKEEAFTPSSPRHQTSTDPNLKLCNRIEVLKVRNELTKLANPSTFEPPNTSLKTDRSELRNLDRFTSSSSPLLTWLWCSSVCSHPLTAAAMFLACSCLSLPHTQPPKWLGFSPYISQGGTSAVGCEPRSTVDTRWTSWADIGLPTHLHVEGHGPTNSPPDIMEVSLPTDNHAGEPTAYIELCSCHHLSQHISPIVICVHLLML
jgi:hypothetical protein